MSASTERRTRFCRALCLCLALALLVSLLAACGRRETASGAASKNAESAAPSSSPFELSADAIAGFALDDWLPGECLVAVFERGGQLLLAYGLAEPVDGEDRFTFTELFTGTPLFRFEGRYDGGSSYYRYDAPIDFEPLDPVMEGRVTLLEVNNFGCDENYFGWVDSPYDQGVDSSYDHGVATLRDAGDRYFNLIPAELRLVTLAPDAGEIVWGETPYELLYPEEAGGGTEPEPDPDLRMRRLSAEEEAAAVEALGVVDPDGVFYDDSYERASKSFDRIVSPPALAACFLKDGRPHVMWGTPEPDPETESFVFCDFFTRVPLFRYEPYEVISDGEIFFAATPMFVNYGWESIGITPLHAYFDDPGVEMRVVLNWQVVVNYFNELDIPWDEETMALVYEMTEETDPDTGETVYRDPASIECSRLDMARKYVTLTPRALWVTAADLAAAEAAG